MLCESEDGQLLYDRLISADNLKRVDQKNRLLPSHRAVASYLRFSYPMEDIWLPEAERSFCSEIRFCFEPERTKEEYVSELSLILDNMLEEERQYSDAAFLSSGVDSSLIAFGIHAKRTFSVAYEEQEFDESPLALEAARKLGSEHHVVLISPSDYFNSVGEALSCRGLPTGDASYIALYIAAKEASRFTDTVCSGEGPDEMFCGYPCYSRYYNNPSEDFWLSINTIMDVGEIPLLPDYGGDGFLKMNAFDLTRWMNGNILPNVAAAAKGAGISIRMPYMRRDLWDFALALPVKYKANQNLGKRLFREVAQRTVGYEIAFREKRGFPVPVRKWMRREPFKTQVLDALTSNLARNTLMCADVEGILRDFYLAGEDMLWKQVWEMFTLIRWLETLDGEKHAVNQIL